MQKDVLDDKAFENIAYKWRLIYSQLKLFIDRFFTRNAIINNPLNELQR